MKSPRLFHTIVLFSIFLTGCAGNSSLVKFIKEGGLESKGMTNLALASNGARVTVSKSNPDHPGSTLINGNTSSGDWDQGEGWESEFEGQFGRGGYVGYGVEDSDAATDRGYRQSFDEGDPSWRGLRIQTRRGYVDTSLGWVVIDFPEEKTVNRAVVYTIDSDKFPADKFGVSDLMLQFWSGSANSWVTVERFGKGKGQTRDTVKDNKKGVLTLRFQPVETTQMRLVIRWTNDSDSYRRGDYEYAKGTVRLVEVEIYGYEKEKADEKEEIDSTAVVQDANKAAEIEIVIENYVDGYNRQNPGVLMSSISPNYSKDGETYQDLEERMASIFAGHKDVQLELQDVGVFLTDDGAVVTSAYTAQYEGVADDSQPSSASGTLTFRLSDASGYWKITRIDSQ